MEEVSKTVSANGVEAPEAKSSFVAMDKERAGLVDENGLPLIYDKAAIQKYWEGQGSALQTRWLEFLGESVPFLTRVAGLLISGGADALNDNAADLAKDARVSIEKLGPTYVKMGQMMSVRPDVLPQAALNELTILQDGVEGFETSIAREMVEKELGCKIEEVFDEFGADPAAAASLAQVYRARLKATGEYVAVKVQRPGVQELVSKDLYVLRRAAEVYQGLVTRFAPQQRTDYVALLNEWAVGFYTELDFVNEASNMKEMARVLREANVNDVRVPRVYDEYTTRKMLVSEWIDGRKLSECEPSEIRDLIAIGQECFLVQLLQAGFFHSDPHPGNLMRPNDQSNGKLVLIDFGLVAKVEQEDMDAMVSSIVHLANKDYAALVDDFIRLEILPADCNRGKVIPLMDKALSPYVKGGGAQVYKSELEKMYGLDGTMDGTVGGFQAMTNDMLTVLNDIPFSIPPLLRAAGARRSHPRGPRPFRRPDLRTRHRGLPLCRAQAALLRPSRAAAGAAGGALLRHHPRRRGHARGDHSYAPRRTPQLRRRHRRQAGGPSLRRPRCRTRGWRLRRRRAQVRSLARRGRAALAARH